MEKNRKKDYLHNKNIQDAVLFLMLAIALIVYSLVNHYSTVKLEWKLSPYLFPLLIAVFVTALSLSLIADGKKQIELNERIEKKTAIHWKSVLFTIGSSIVYYRIIKYFKFIPSTILFLVAMFLHLGERRIWLIAIISVICSVSVYVIFGVFLHVMLP